jgi:hypothetical protein
MANYYSSTYATYKIDPMLNRSGNLADEDNTITGGRCVWEIGELGAGRNLTVARYEPTDYSEYPTEGKPHVIIKLKGDYTANNLTIRCDDGAGGYTTLHTENLDLNAGAASYRYIVLRLSSTSGADGRKLWEKA